MEPSSPADAPTVLEADATDAVDQPVERPLSRVRPWELGLVAAFVLALYVPKLGEYGLWDPWETHYGEVARRMLEDHDWIRLKWQNENFRSKPVLTFWLMAGSMKLLGVAEDGGYSGEMVASHAPEWAMRLPFALFGCLGIVVLWWALARLYSKRAAWMAAVILATSPYYFFISRQAITDMPSCGMFVASMALFAMAWLEHPDRPLPRWKGQRPTFVFLGVFSIVVLWQLLYFLPRVAENRFMLGPRSWLPGWLVMIPFFVAWAGVALWAVLGTKSMRQIYLYWFYLLNGLAILAKGPISPALCAMSMVIFWLVTADWRMPRVNDAGDAFHQLAQWAWRWIRKTEVLKGLLIMIAVSIPWHVAIYLKDGNAWLNEYVSQHLLGRAFRGVHGDRGTFDYFLGQLGVGMWPWIALVPAALIGVAILGRGRTREQKLRILFAVWAIVAFTFFSAIQTKFHHYILPAVPAFAVLVAMWLDDLWERRAQVPAIGLTVAVLLFVMTSLDVVFKQERFVHLFIYRYDRPWPYGDPWKIDYTIELAIFAGMLLAFLCGMFVPAVRRYMIAGLGVAAAAFCLFAIDVLLVGASPHWGQRTLHETYYKNREIHGVDLVYYGPREIADDWGSGKDLMVRSLIPVTLREGDPMKVSWELRGGGEQVKEKGEMMGRVSRIDKGDDRFWIEVPPSEREKIAALVAKGKLRFEPERRRWLSVNADRLIAWQLNWRGENFYSGGEIWNPRITDAQTVYMDTDNKKFLEYLKPRIGKGRTFWIVTEKGRLANLRNVLPTETAKQTLQGTELDNSSNKFGLGRFTLDQGQSESVVGPSGPITPPEEVNAGGGL